MTQEKDPSELESHMADELGSDALANPLDPTEDSLIADSMEPRIGSSFGAIEDNVSTESFDSLIAGPSPSHEDIPPLEPLVEPSKGRTSRDSKNPLKTFLITAGVLVLVAALGFFGLMGWDAYQANKKVEQQQAQQKEEAKEKAKAIKEADNPFSVLVGKVDPPSEDPLTATVENNQIKAGAATLSVKGGTLTPTVNGCKLIAVTDICLGARGKLGNGDFDVLLVKDISRTRLLDNPSDFKEIKTAGATIAASLAIDMGSKEGPARLGALTAHGPTGFVLIFPAGTSAERVDEVIKATTVI